MNWRDWVLLMTLLLAFGAFYNTRVLDAQLRKLYDIAKK